MAMFQNRTFENKWLRRYRMFFVIGLFILSLQLYIAVKFFAIDSKNQIESTLPVKNHNDRIINLDYIADEHNSARLTKEEIDDEDNAVNSINFNKNVEKLERVRTNPPKNKSVLRVEELDFIPQCEIQTKDAVSAIHRSKSQHCKQLIVNITCLIQQGKLYPKQLDNHCPKNGFVSGRSLGCYQDEKNFRLLSGYYAVYKNNNSPEHCIRMCLQSGFVYAGVQYSKECFCGNDQPPSSARLPDPSCNLKCPANPRKACGGYYTINIYETGITAFTPQQAVLNGNSTKKRRIRIAYLLTLNGRAIRQVRRLIKALFHVDHYFYIHVDARQDYMYRELLPLETKYTNIKLERKRFATIWGGASLLKMLRSSMKTLLNLDWHWDFIINLSESDFPVKTNDKLIQFLSHNPNKNFVKSHGREVQRFIQKQGLDKTFIECDAHMWRTGDRQLPWGIQVDGGSDWVALSRPFIEYVTGPPDNLIKGLLSLFEYTLLPAESFFHTVLRNSMFCDTYIDNNLHITNWKRKLGCKCQYKSVVDWCGCSPNDFKNEDWSKILATQPKQIYFARKFEPVVNQAIIQQLEEWLYGPYFTNTSNLSNYWQSLYHYHDLSPVVDDCIYTIAHSLTRLSYKQCPNDFKFVELTNFFQNDIFTGVIITLNSNLSFVEVLFSYKHEVQTKFKRLKSLYVTSDYDQKELLSRNFGRFLGPLSEPVLIYEFLPALNFKVANISFVWINPSGTVVDVNQVQLDANYQQHFVKLGVKGPLLPGVWNVKVISDRLIAQTSFLITPLEFISKTELTLPQAQFLHNSFKGKDVGEWSKYGKLGEEKVKLEELVKSNAQRLGVELQEWIDSLVSKFYFVMDSCSTAEGFKFQFCRNTNWSTFAPDPKSDISSINLFYNNTKR